MENTSDNLVISNPEILGGTPVFNGTRVPVKFLFDYIESGETVDEFIFNFPSVTKDQALQLLEFAQKLIFQQVPDENFA